MRSIGLPELLVIMFVAGIFLIPMVPYLITLQRAMERCSPQARTISPGQVWLMLIPLFNLVWQFLLVGHIARSLYNEFQARGIPIAETEPAKGIGLAMCILTVSSIIPLLGIVTGLAALVCWIIYWVKVAEYSRKLVLPSYYPSRV